MSIGSRLKAASFAGALLGALALSLGAASAETLTVGLREVPRSLDPHWMTAPSTFQVNAMIYEPLVRRNDDGVPVPALAQSWEVANEKTWTFHLRKDAKWHDGTPFTAEDIKFTYQRARNVPKSPSSFSTYLNQVANVEVVDAHTLRITTTETAPALLEKLAYVLIVSQKHGQNATTETYNTGQSAIGTGPYKFGSWTPNDRTVIEKNADYWGEKEPWDKVVYRAIPNDASRLAALLSGDIDVLDTVPSQETEKLKSNAAVAVWSRMTARIAYVTIDVEGALQSGKVTGPAGETLEKNPLAEPKVRAAMAAAIDRAAFVKFIYRGEAEPTAQYLPEGVPGYDPDIKLAKGDIAKAKALLDESGWAGKFKLEISAASAFFPQSVPAAEAMAQTWSRVGIPTSVTATPYPVFLKLRNERKITVSVSAYQNSTRSGDNFFPPLLHTRDTAKGYGVLNFIRYSNAQADAKIEEAGRTLDVPKRSRLFAEAAKLALADNVFIPLWFLAATHATKNNLTFKPRVDSIILATNVRPKR
jgi:peptide/nickel transport system substrate-binding protein